jgi:hypothetical protein
MTQIEIGESGLLVGRRTTNSEIEQNEGRHGSVGNETVRRRKIETAISRTHADDSMVAGQGGTATVQVRRCPMGMQNTFTGASMILRVRARLTISSNKIASS